MLYFSKLRIILVSIITLLFVYIALSNFIRFDDVFFNKKINLGLDLQGGSYLLLEIDNDPILIQKLQITTTTIRNYLKNKDIIFKDLKIVDKNIFFQINRADQEKVKLFYSFFLIPVHLLLNKKLILVFFLNNSQMLRS